MRQRRSIWRHGACVCSQLLVVVAPMLPSVVLNEVASIFSLRVSGGSISGYVAQNEPQVCISCCKLLLSAKRFRMESIYPSYPSSCLLAASSLRNLDDHPEVLLSGSLRLDYFRQEWTPTSPKFQLTVEQLLVFYNHHQRATLFTWLYYPRVLSH